MDGEVIFARLGSKDCTQVKCAMAPKGCRAVFGRVRSEMLNAQPPVELRWVVLEGNWVREWSEDDGGLWRLPKRPDRRKTGMAVAGRVVIEGQEVALVSHYPARLMCPSCGCTQVLDEERLSVNVSRLREAGYPIPTKTVLRPQRPLRGA